MLFLFLFQASTLVIFFLLVLFENEYSSQTVCCLCVCLLLRVGADGSMVLRLCFDSPDTFLSLIAVSVSRRDPKKTAPLTPDSSPPRDGAEAASALHRAVSISASSGKTIASRGRMWGKRDVGAEAGADGRRGVFFFLFRWRGEGGDFYHAATHMRNRHFPSLYQSGNRDNGEVWRLSLTLTSGSVKVSTDVWPLSFHTWEITLERVISCGLIQMPNQCSNLFDP